MIQRVKQFQMLLYRPTFCPRTLGNTTAPPILKEPDNSADDSAEMQRADDFLQWWCGFKMFVKAIWTRIFAFREAVALPLLAEIGMRKKKEKDVKNTFLAF